MTGLLDSLLPATDAILGVRDSIGVVLKPVYFVTRTWTGQAPGDGSSSDAAVQMFPSPKIVSYAQDIRLKEGGAIKAGDIVLQDISRNKFKESDLDGSSPARNVEKFFKVGVKLYQVINVREKYVTFNVQLRELTNQAGY